MRNAVAIQEVKRLFFSDDSPVTLIPGLEGQGLTDEGTLALGYRAGPQLHVTHLLHEMSHLVELEAHRLNPLPITSWGFRNGKFWQVGTHYGWEERTDKSVLREGRVWSYQLSIQRALGIRGTAKQLVSSAVYLPAFLNYKIRIEVKTEAEALKRFEAQVEEGTKEFTFERFTSEWKDRMTLLQSVPPRKFDTTDR